MFLEQRSTSAMFGVAADAVDDVGGELTPAPPTATQRTA